MFWSETREKCKFSFERVYLQKKIYNVRHCVIPFGIGNSEITNESRSNKPMANVVVRTPECTSHDNILTSHVSTDSLRVYLGNSKDLRFIDPLATFPALASLYRLLRLIIWRCVDPKTTLHRARRSVDRSAPRPMDGSGF